MNARLKKKLLLLKEQAMKLEPGDPADSFVDLRKRITELTEIFEGRNNLFQEGILRITEGLNCMKDMELECFPSGCTGGALEAA